MAHGVVFLSFYICDGRRYCRGRSRLAQILVASPMAINLRCSIIEQKLTGSNIMAMAPVAHREIGAWSKSIFMNTGSLLQL